MTSIDNLKWPDLYVAGCDHYRDACKLLIDTVKKNGISSVEIKLEHHPENPYDSNAVAVYATLTSGMFFKSSKRKQIGHIPANTAADMVYFREKGGNFSAVLAQAKISNGEYPFNIKLDIYSDYKSVGGRRVREKTKAKLNKIICFTEGLPLTKQTAESLARQKGYEVRNEVTKDVDYLIIGIGSENDPKHKRALELLSEGYNIDIETADKIFTINEMVDADS